MIKTPHQAIALWETDTEYRVRVMDSETQEYVARKLPKSFDQLLGYVTSAMDRPFHPTITLGNNPSLVKTNSRYLGRSIYDTFNERKREVNQKTFEALVSHLALTYQQPVEIHEQNIAFQNKTSFNDGSSPSVYTFQQRNGKTSTFEYNKGVFPLNQPPLDDTDIPF